MANKAILAVLLICLTFTSVKSAGVCLLTYANLCTGTGACLFDATLLTTLCALTGGTSAILNLTLGNSQTINFGSALTSSLSLGGLTINAGTDVNAATTINFNEAVNLAGDLVVTGAAVINSVKGTVVKVNGNLRVAAQSTLNIAGNVTVAGTTYIQGKLHLAGDLAVDAAQTAWIVATSSSVTVDGSASTTAAISGNGGIDASLLIQGNVTINVGNSPGAVFVRGDMTLSSTSTLTLEVDSTTSFDKYYIGGAFNRAGILHVDVGSYRPNNKQVFIFATHTSSSGSFSISRGNFDATLNKIHPKYDKLATSFQYGNAAAIALPFALIALCIVGLVF